MDYINKHYSAILQASVLCLGGLLFWFAFVYYPGVVADLKLGKTLPANIVFKPVSATSHTFPIKTETYRIEFDQTANVYYSAIAGRTLPEYVFNRDNAKLALKSALSMDDLCTVDVAYASREGFEVPQQYRDSRGC